MCYSILVETNLKKLERDFRAALDMASFEQAYRIRALGLENVKIPRAIDRAIALSDHPRAVICQQLAERYTADQQAALADKVADQDAKVIALKAKLAKRWSKTNQQLLARAQRVKAKAQRDLASAAAPLGSSAQDQPVAARDEQVFQYSFCPVLTSRSGQNVISLKRYQLKPRHAHQDAPSQINMFNARRDALLTRPSWKPLFGKNHGLVLMKGFYEWVPHPVTGKAAIIRFFPDDGSAMWVPCLYDRWQGDGYHIDSFAVITDDPPAEIDQAGHDRCPIYPSWEHIDTWLAGGTTAASDRILASRQPVHYSGQFVPAATDNDLTSNTDDKEQEKETDDDP